jgi:hypothetical protein
MRTLHRARGQTKKIADDAAAAIAATQKEAADR